MSDLKREIRRQMHREAREQRDWDTLSRDVEQLHAILEAVKVAIVTAGQTGEDQAVPGIRFFGVPLHVHAADLQVVQTEEQPH